MYNKRWVDSLIDIEKLGIHVGTFEDADYGPCEKSTPERPLPRPIYLGAGILRSIAKSEARRKWLSQFDNALIPQGDECTGCPYLTQETINLVNMFGDETGNTRTTIYCDRFDTVLEYDAKQYLENKKYKKVLLCKRAMQEFSNPKQEQAMDDKELVWWRPAEGEKPANEQDILICVKEKSLITGKEFYKTIRGFYTTGDCYIYESSYDWESWDNIRLLGLIYDEEADDYKIPEGWWECTEYSDDVMRIYEEVAYWMPLPKTPQIKEDQHD